MRKFLIGFLLLSASMFAQTTCVNCGTTVFATGGTTNNVIPKSNGSSALGDSALTDTGTQVNSTEAIRLPNNTMLLWRNAANNADINGMRVNASDVLQLVGSPSVGGKFSSYNNIATAGEGLIAAYGATSQKAETTTADANVLTYTPPATAGTYRVNVNISVSSATSGVVAWTLSWTDSNGNAQSNIAMPLFQLGTAAPNTTFTTSAAGNYSGTSTIDINNAAAAIVVKWVGGGTTAAKMSAVVEQLQ